MMLRPACLEMLESRVLLASTPVYPDVAVGTMPNKVISADLDRDGKLNLITSDYNSNTVSIRLGNGNGTFGAPTQYRGDGAPIGVTAADVNANGLLELLVANWGTATVSVHTG